MRLPKLPFAVVSWSDAWVDGTEAVSLADVALKHHAMIHLTAGWILYQNEEGISIANEFCPDDETYRGRSFIPAEMKPKVTFLKLSKPRSPKDPVKPTVMPEP